MPLPLSTPVLSVGALTVSQAVESTFNPPWKATPQVTQYTRPEVVYLFERVIYWCGIFGVNHDIVIPQILHETNWLRFTGDVPFGYHNFAGLGATGGVPGHRFPLPGGFIPEDGIDAGALATVAHHAVYRWGAKEHWPEHLRAYAGEHVDPRYDEAIWKVRSIGKNMIVLGDYRGTWAVPGTTYPESISNRYDIIAAFPKGGSGVLPTDRMISLLRERGFEVHDRRGKTPVNPNPSHRYRTMPYSQVNYIIQHWTGDAFSESTLDTITGRPQAGKDIHPGMSVEDEIKLLDWYARYHISKDGGTWGGLAYGTMIFPSGRIYVAWDIGTLTYHAFTANSVSYAVSAPLANRAEPSPACVEGLKAIWDILFYETPEIPAAKERLLGHQEAVILDSRNKTSCPGTLLPHIRDYRAAVAPPVNPPDPNTRLFPETGQSVMWGFKGLWEWYEEQGRVWSEVGFPQTGEFQTLLQDTGGMWKATTAQIFDRAVFVWEPWNEDPEWQVHTATIEQAVRIREEAISQGIYDPARAPGWKPVAEREGAVLTGVVNE